MTDTSVASDLLQSLDVKGDFPSQITFYCHCLINNSAQSLNLIISQISDTCVRINLCFSKNFVCAWSTNSINVGKTDFNTFLSW